MPLDLIIVTDLSVDFAVYCATFFFCKNITKILASANTRYYPVIGLTEIVLKSIHRGDETNGPHLIHHKVFKSNENCVHTRLL